MKRLYYAFCIAHCVLAIGCGSRSHITGLVDVQITVMQEGKPLEKAIVVLESPSVMFSPSGITDKDGVAIIYTSGTERGAPQGEYKVCVIKMETIELGERVETWRYVEEKYATSATTPLSVSVSGKTKASVDAGKAIKVEVK